MFYITLNVMFNALLLGLALELASLITHISPHVTWCFAYIVCAVLAFTAYTKSANDIIDRFILSQETITHEIYARVAPLLQEVINKANQQYGTYYVLKDFTLKINPNKEIKIHALGYNNISISCGALNTFDDQELCAVLAHYLGKLYYRDSIKSVALTFSSSAAHLISAIYNLYIKLTNTFTRIAHGEFRGIMVLISYIPFILFLPVIILNWFGVKIHYLLNLWVNKKANYRADAFAKSLGYQDSMIGALKKIDDVTPYDNSLIAKLTMYHLATLSRINALKTINAKPKLNTATRTDDKIKALSVLAFGGLIWCVWIIYH